MISANYVAPVISVLSGEVWAAKQAIILRSDAIGSCVVIAAYDPRSRIGGMAHVMLPGRSLKSGFGKNTKYARDAITDLLFKILRLGAVRERVEVCIIGGANVLNDKDDKICQLVINSVTELLRQEEITIMARDVGGVTRRWASLDIESGALRCASGDHEPELLYMWRKQYA